MLRRFFFLRHRVNSLSNQPIKAPYKGRTFTTRTQTCRIRSGYNRTLASIPTIQEESPVELFSSVIPPISRKDKRSSSEVPHRHVLISHGLFGTSTSWRGIARVLTQKCNVTAHMLDMRNHGSSPHTQQMNYDLMVEDIKQYIKKHNLERVSLIAHSMGGRVAMQMALEYPELIDKLIVVDVTPLSHLPVETFKNYIHYMKKVDLQKVQTRKEADECLRTYIPQFGLRRYLLANLVPVTGLDTSGHNAFKWRLNFDTIEKSLPDLMNLSVKREHAQFTGDTLFLGGVLSDYIKEEYRPAIRSLFPNCKIEMIEGAGHWVHVDQPEAFISSVTSFLNKSDSDYLSSDGGDSFLPPQQLNLTFPGVPSTSDRRFLSLERLD